MSKNFQLLLEEAHELGLSTDIVYPEKEVVTIQRGSQKIIVKEVFSLANDVHSASAVLAKNKEVTYRFWERENIPFPRSSYFKNIATFPTEATNFHLQFPVVFKKSNGKKGVGIRTNITSFEELSEIVVESTGSFIVQEMVFGKEYRLLIYQDRLLGALEFTPPHITGDGVNTIGILIQKKNLNRSKKIIINEQVIRTLEKNSLSLDAIPENGSCILLQEKESLTEGGSSIDCTEIVHANTIALARRAARSVNMKLAGLDLICEDISLNPDKQKISFLEANSFPSLAIHYKPTVGKPRRVIKEILEDIFCLESH